MLSDFTLDLSTVGKKFSASQDFGCFKEFSEGRKGINETEPYSGRTATTKIMPESGTVRTIREDKLT